MELSTISVNFAGTSPPIKRFTAPSGYMYRVHAIHAINYVAGSNRFLISNRYYEEIDDLSYNDAIFSFDCAIDGHHANLSLGENYIKAKHLSLGFITSTSANVHCIIYYTLEKASVKDLVYEFIKRGKSP